MTDAPAAPAPAAPTRDGAHRDRGGLRLGGAAFFCRPCRLMFCSAACLLAHRGGHPPFDSAPPDR
jgi:hypothetical protein